MKTQQEEIWKDIPVAEGSYQVSNLGRIKSLNFKGGKNEKIMTNSKHRDGYLKIAIYINNKPKTFQVHQLVAMAFLNHIPCGHKLVVNHINFNKTDNRVENLEIITSRKNCNKKHLKSKSKYTGVSYDKSTKKWKSRINLNRKEVFLGLFDTEEEAYEYYKKALFSIEKGLQIEVKRKEFTSKYIGVHYNKINKKWCSALVFDKKKIHIAYTNTEREAAILRDKKIIALGLNQSKLQILKPLNK